MSMKQVNMWHIAMMGPILCYIGDKEDKANNISYAILATLTISILFTVRKPNIKKLNYYNIVNLLHYLVIFPMFLFIIYKRNKLPKYVFKFIKYLGISVIAIHIYKLLKK